MTEKLKVTQISKSFGNKKILDHISFRVEAGEFLSVLGPSGCGKTTLLRILAGLVKADPSETSSEKPGILKDGRSLQNVPPSGRGMGIVFQDYALFQNMTVLGNVEYALKHNPKTRGSSRQIALDMLEQVGLSAYLDRKPLKLSGGQQQRVAIARSLALKPDVMLFDEPFSALDADTRLSLRNEIKDLQKRFGTTMLFVTHDQEEAFVLSDRLLILSEGRVQQLDTPENILRAPANDFVESFVNKNLELKFRALRKFLE